MRVAAVWCDFLAEAMRAIAKWEEVPIFDSEEAEADFWAENKPDLRLMEAAVAGNSETSESVAISLRIGQRRFLPHVLPGAERVRKPGIAGEPAAAGGGARRGARRPGTVAPPCRSHGHHGGQHGTCLAPSAAECCRNRLRAEPRRPGTGIRAGIRRPLRPVASAETGSLA